MKTKRQRVSIFLIFALTVIGLCWYVVKKNDVPAPLNAERQQGKGEAVDKGIYSEFRLDDRIQKAFIGIAISGGGSRAANFAGSVLSELDRMGILQRASVISSVSGGSVAASLYVSRADAPLRGKDKNEYWKQMEATLSQDLIGRWLRIYARPDQILKTTFDGYSRTSVMADVLNDVLLHGAPSLVHPSKNPKALTFADLPKDGPLLLINATAENDLNGVAPTNCINRGWRGQGLRLESIAFTNSFFQDCLQSDLGSYRLADGVMASASFPGLFNSMTLAAYPAPDKPGQVQYLHLLDGGPSDNLGLEGIFGKADESPRVL